MVTSIRLKLENSSWEEISGESMPIFGSAITYLYETRSNDTQ